MSLALLDNPVLPSRSRAHAWLLDLRTQWRNSSLQLIERCNHPDRPIARAYVAQIERPRPQDYAAYHDLLVGMSVQGSDREAVATSLLARAPRLAAGQPGLALPRLTNFSAGFYAYEARSLMSRWLGLGMGMEVDGRARLGCISGPRYMAQSSLVRRAMRCLACHAPEAHDEITQVVSEIVLCTVDASGDERFAWRSACSFAVWGAVFLDPTHHADELDYLCSVVEEGARLALFAASLRQPLVMAPPTSVDGLVAERQNAQLETMDARIHAAFAAARLAHVLQRLQDATWPGDHPVPRTASLRRGWIPMPWSVERLQLAHARATARFWANHAALSNSRWLSPAGRELMHQTCVFMAHAYGWPDPVQMKNSKNDN